MKPSYRLKWWKQYQLLAELQYHKSKTALDNEYGDK